MSTALASSKAAIRNAFATILAWIRIAWFDLIVPRGQFIFVIEIYNIVKR